MTTIRRCDFCPRHPRRLLALHLGGLVQRHLSRVSEVPRNPARARQASLPRRVGSRQPRRPPLREPRQSRSPRSPPVMAPTSAASPISTLAARLASRKTATGPKPTPAISSTGTSKPRKPCPGSPARRSGSSRTSPLPFAWRIPSRASIRKA